MQVLEPIIAAYAPDLIIVSAGFDAVVGDPLGGMSLSPELFGHLTERMARLAKGKLVLALEGGYNLRMTAECARHCMQVCCNPFRCFLQPLAAVLCVGLELFQNVLMYAQFDCLLKQSWYGNLSGALWGTGHNAQRLLSKTPMGPLVSAVSAVNGHLQTCAKLAELMCRCCWAASRLP